MSWYTTLEDFHAATRQNARNKYLINRYQRKLKGLSNERVHEINRVNQITSIIDELNKESINRSSG